MKLKTKQGRCVLYAYKGMKLFSDRSETEKCLLSLMQGKNTAHNETKGRWAKTPAIATLSLSTISRPLFYI